jgi:hypothetical protein
MAAVELAVVAVGLKRLPQNGAGGRLLLQIEMRPGRPKPVSAFQTGEPAVDFAGRVVAGPNSRKRATSVA